MYKGTRVQGRKGACLGAAPGFLVVIDFFFIKSGWLFSKSGGQKVQPSKETDSKRIYLSGVDEPHF
jgi:hypothetical protein